jgi:hypothetical protein
MPMTDVPDEDRDDVAKKSEEDSAHGDTLN